MIKFKNLKECKDYLRSKGLRKGIFFLESEGFDSFYTLEKTKNSNVHSLTGEVTRWKVNVDSNKIRLVHSKKNTFSKSDKLSMFKIPSLKETIHRY
jgi:hypothetical protein